MGGESEYKDDWGTRRSGEGRGRSQRAEYIFLSWELCVSANRSEEAGTPRGGSNLAIVPQSCSSSIFERCWSTGVAVRKGTSKRREVPWRLSQGLIGGEKVDFISN